MAYELKLLGNKYIVEVSTDADEVEIIIIIEMLRNFSLPRL